MSVSAKLWSGFFATLVLGAVLIYQLSVIRDLASANGRLATISSRVAVIGTEQLYRLDQLAENSAKYRVTQDPRYAEQFVLLARRVSASFDDLDTLTVTSDERVHADRISRLLERLRTMKGAFEGIVEGSEATPAGVELIARGEGWIEDLRTETIRLTQATRSAMQQEAARAARQARRAESRAWLVAGLGLLLGALVTLTAARSVSAALLRLAAGTRRVAEGDFDYRLSGAREREFRHLESDFNVMVERLSELEQMKKDFLAGISHDLKSPLASIRETLTVLLDEVPGPLVERQRRLLRLASQSGERLSAMISNLLDLAQLEARVTRYEFAPHDLAGLVRGIVAEMETRFRERDVAAELESPESLLVECDAERMAQVIQNLIDNALAVAPGGTAIRVALTSPVGYPASIERSETEEDVAAMNLVRLEVGDRGPGVPEELADKIFEKFQRGEGGYSQGVGLGLTISREIVVAHDGRIWLEARPGGGSVFIVEIPVTHSGDFRRDLDTRASVEAIA